MALILSLHKIRGLDTCITRGKCYTVSLQCPRAARATLLLSILNVAILYRILFVEERVQLLSNTVWKVLEDF